MFLKESRRGIEKAYQDVKNQIGDDMERIDFYILSLPEKESIAMKYLYATMPFSDIGNYPVEVFRDFAEHGVWLYETKPELRALPEWFFLQYVLYHRVNEEEIRPCRKLFYEKMKETIEGKTMKETALEVNYWCAGEVAYESSDTRTLSALAVYERGYGRCGEESVFAVNALRSAGIPARQVYAPFWSHCDDNHAWVEVYMEDGWHFLGACEPEPLLDLGWFEYAASRAMMVHARRFDQRFRSYLSNTDATILLKEELIGSDGMTVLENELKRYTDATFLIEVVVEDENGDAVPDCPVWFEVLNEAAFRPIAKCYTDENGKVGLTTGGGDLHLFAADQNKYAEELLDVKKQQSVVLRLRSVFTPVSEAGPVVWTEMDLAAPNDRLPVSKRPTDEQKQKGRARLDNLRKKQMQKRRLWVNPEVEQFLNSLRTQSQTTKEMGERLLETLTDKDITDISCKVLSDHLHGAMKYAGMIPETLFFPYVLCPRAGTEILTCFRTWFQKHIPQEEQEQYRKAPDTLWEMIDTSIREFPNWERATVMTTPKSCYEMGIGSKMSKRILFVAMARSFGIPVRLCPEDGTAQYWEKDRFVSAECRDRKNAMLIIHSDHEQEWKYGKNWTVTKVTGEMHAPLCLEEEGWKEGTYILDLSEGVYRIVTALRLPNGTQQAKQCIISLKSGERKDLKLEGRKAKLSEMFQNLILPEFFVTDQKGKAISSKTILQEGVHLLFWAGIGEEPTEHILNEMLEQKEAFQSVSCGIAMFLPPSQDMHYPLLREMQHVFPDIRIYYDDFEEHVPAIGRRLYVDHERLPILAVADHEQHIVYSISGYQVGTGNLLLRIFEELKRH